MKRKGKRHKLVAAQFLSNISLDGSRQHDHHHATSSASCRENPVTYSNVSSALSIIAHDPLAFVSREEPVGVLNEPLFLREKKLPNVSDPVVSPERNLTRTKFNQTNGFIDSKPKEGYSEPGVRRNHGLSSESCELRSTLTAQPGHFYPGHSRSRQNGTTVDAKLALHPIALTGSSGKRFAICSTGIRRNVLAVFSVLSNQRKTTALPNKRGSRHNRSNAQSSRHISESESKAACLFSSSSLKGAVDLVDRWQPAVDGGDVPCLSSLPPTDDEVLSLARMLHARPHVWLPIANAASPVPAVRVYGPTGLEPELFATVGADSVLCVISIDQTGCSTIVNRFKSSLGYVNSRRTHLSFPSSNHHPHTSQWPPRLRRRHSSSTSGGPCTSLSSVNSTAMCYPDPLCYYSPTLLDDPDLLVATGRRLFPLPNYLVSVLSYVRPTEQKRNVNREFHDRFPTVQLTLTKLRSIKSVLVQIVFRLSFDLWVAAHAHVLFEKLILKLFVNKANRRLCASAALLISAKLNDIKGSDLHNLIQELESNFRISRRDLLVAEVEVSLGLEFCLIPTEAECVPHYFRIHKQLDLTPPYPISCCVGQTGSIQSLCNEIA